MTDPKISRSETHSRRGEFFCVFYDRSMGHLAEHNMTGMDIHEMQAHVDASWPKESVRAIVWDNRFCPAEKVFERERFNEVLARPRRDMPPPADHFPSRRLFQGRAF
jgi:hypothetical protein